MKDFEAYDYHIGRLQFVVEAALSGRVPAFQHGDPQLYGLHDKTLGERHDFFPNSAASSQRRLLCSGRLAGLYRRGELFIE